MASSLFLAACSPRKGGNTDTAALLLKEELGGSSAIVRIADRKLKPCLSCGYCGRHPGRCLLDASGDEADLLYRQLFASPVSCIVSPIYFYHMPAQAKVWMDRAQRFWSGGKPGEGRVMGAVLLAARPRGEKLFAGTETSLRCWATVLGVTLLEPLCLYGLEEAGDLSFSAEAQKRIREYARVLSERAVAF